MNDIHNQFVTSLNEADGNIAFICQYFYALVLMKELGLDHNNTGINKTYIPIHKTDGQVTSDHTTFWRSKFKLVVHEENKKLPNI